MERRDWMSERGYESGQAAERRVRNSLPGNRNGTAVSKKIGAGMAAIGCSLVLAAGYMLWPYLVRFLTLSDKGTRRIKGADNVDWQAAWALVLAVGLVAVIVFAFTKAISLKSIGSYFSEMASFMSLGRARMTAQPDMPPSRQSGVKDTETVGASTGAGTGKLLGSQKTFSRVS